MDIQESQLKAGKSCLDHDFGLEHDGFKGTIRKQDMETLEIESFENEKGNYLGFYDSVYDCIKNKEQPPVLAIEIIDVLKVIEASIESSTEGYTILF